MIAKRDRSQCETKTAPLCQVWPSLAEIRQSKGISLAQISANTKIGLYYLQAIEDARLELLPGGIFNTSYLRQYARAIDFEESQLLACYSARREGLPSR